jgi:hypothetical protein
MKKNSSKSARSETSGKQQFLGIIITDAASRSSYDSRSRQPTAFGKKKSTPVWIESGDHNSSRSRQSNFLFQQGADQRRIKSKMEKIVGLHT